MGKTINLRAHHLLCTVLYKGKGYSEQFTEEMSKVVDELKNPLSDTKIVLQTSPDAICRYCPNKMDDGSCALDTSDGPKVGSMDERVLEYFELPAGTELDSKDVYRHIEKRITGEFFENTCSTCLWCKMGLCSFDEYMNRIGLFHQSR